MSAALSRPNPLAPIGHAGKSAPTLADERIAISDLPKFAATPTAAANGFRAALIQRDADSARAANRELRDALAAASGFRAALIKRDADNARAANRELREALAAILPLAGRAVLTQHDEAVVTRATRALTLGGLL